MICKNLFLTKDHNTGDRWSSPSHYFDFLKPHNLHQYQPSEESVVIGGGGLLWFPDTLRRIFNQKGKVITWGIGANTHKEKQINYPDWFSLAALNGVRDWGSPFPWVPCVSCLHPLFDRSYEIKQEVTFYSHKDCHLIKNTLDNTAPIEIVIPQLGRSEVIVTNSYHGVYWGILLNRKVICVGADCSRFYGFRWSFPIIKKVSDWRSALQETSNHPEALEQSREANWQHFEKVLTLVA